MGPWTQYVRTGARGVALASLAALLLALTACGGDKGAREPD